MPLTSKKVLPTPLGFVLPPNVAAKECPTLSNPLLELGLFFKKSVVELRQKAHNNKKHLSTFAHLSCPSENANLLPGLFSLPFFKLSIIFYPAEKKTLPSQTISRVGGVSPWDFGLF